MSFKRKYSDSYNVGYLSDVGNIRQVNEDYLGCYEGNNFNIYVIADGMGGHNAGDVASKIAVENCIEYIKELDRIYDLEIILRSAIVHANSIIYGKSQVDEKLKGMGTTITACLVKGEDVVIANVGDSSCYIVNEHGLKKITKDHSLVQELVDDGSITEQEAVKHPNKNIITRALGTKKNVEIDVFKLNTKRIFKCILCTDGLTNEVSRKEMYDIIMNNNNEEACRLLVELCKGKGGKDNISVIVFGGECEDDRNYTGE
ncbi:Stp1/IreP family PP2C-type Ser/Thr phosphatase [Clostridium aestuarii]|uniref:Stp1/IreP family PP2C-type Ser/Thr phosphatase n=1 Tax=Clostridium aestuarii TaxID=338193 RepID=A0ABT4CYF7_9CLOT|nr:Stp1/IreP family PP2C-type Ser/Thr phosphatase [Clostridium aestuarii]MCY6483999.1 Stp1/IreP family PP2C-type Ser/Thr phosphatase [Clostridium aestuarii]